MGQKFQVQFLALVHELVEALQEQGMIEGRAVEATDDNHQVLDTVLALVVTSDHSLPNP